MQFVKVMEAYKRICTKNLCLTCPLGRGHSGHNLDCRSLMTHYPEDAETIIKNWLKSHKENENHEK